MKRLAYGETERGTVPCPECGGEAGGVDPDDGQAWSCDGCRGEGRVWDLDGGDLVDLQRRLASQAQRTLLLDGTHISEAQARNLAAQQCFTVQVWLQRKESEG